jgi:putative hydrolase of the HAD superfamily
LIVERLLFPLRPFGISDKTFILDLNDDFLNRTTLRTKLLPHTMEVLEYLRPKYKMFILSNGFREVQYKKIDNSGLTSFFDGVILSEDAGFNKPHPEIFNYALQKTGMKREETLMIGDSWDADIVGAYNSRIDQVWYDLGLEQSSGFEPTYQITSLLQLKDII